MNKTYTERHLVKNISNRAFKRKYTKYKRHTRIESKTAWMQRILTKNPWLRDPEPLLFEDQAHLDSIAQEVRK